MILLTKYDVVFSFCSRAKTVFQVLIYLLSRLSSFTILLAGTRLALSYLEQTRCVIVADDYIKEH